MAFREWIATGQRICEYCFLFAKDEGDCAPLIGCGDRDPWIAWVCEPCYAQTTIGYRGIGIQRLSILGSMWAARAAHGGTDAMPIAFQNDDTSLLIYAFIWQSYAPGGMWIVDWARGTLEMRRTQDTIESFTTKSNRPSRRSRRPQPSLTIEDEPPIVVRSLRFQQMTRKEIQQDIDRMDASRS